MGIKMRRVRSEDAAAIREIDCRMGGVLGLEIDQKSEEFYKDWIHYHRSSKRCPAFVGTEEGRVIWWVAIAESPGGYPFDGVANLEMGVPQEYSSTELTDILLRFLEQHAAGLGYYKLMACLDGEQRYLLHIYRRAGFRDVGTLRSHGYCRGKLIDLVLMERLLAVDIDALDSYYCDQYDFYREFFEEERCRAAQLRSGRYEVEYEEVETPEDQLPEGIVRFLRTKKGEDGRPVLRPAKDVEDDVEDGEPAEGPARTAPPPPQLPEGIVKFLKSKRNPDGTLANQELPPIVPVKLPGTVRPAPVSEAPPAAETPAAEAPAKEAPAEPSGEAAPEPLLDILPEEEEKG